MKSGLAIEIRSGENPGDRVASRDGSEPSGLLASCAYNGPLWWKIEVACEKSGLAIEIRAVG